jgi:hypothetical protein
MDIPDHWVPGNASRTDEHQVDGGQILTEEATPGGNENCGIPQPKCSALTPQLANVNIRAQARRIWGTIDPWHTIASSALPHS